MPVKILLADKSITIQKVVEMLFSGRDYEIVSASDGETALNEATRIVPDVVLVDVDLPRIDGYSFAAKLKQAPQLAATPVILMMSRDDVYDGAKGKQAGILDNIAKPFESQELIGKVKKALADAAPQRAVPAPSVARQPAAAAPPAPPKPQPPVPPAAPAPLKPKKAAPADIFDIISEAPSHADLARASASTTQEDAIFEVEPVVEEIEEPLSHEGAKALPIGAKAVEEMRAGLGLTKGKEEPPSEIVTFESLNSAMEADQQAAFRPKTPGAPPMRPTPPPIQASTLTEAELRKIAEDVMAKMAKDVFANLPPVRPPQISDETIRAMVDEKVASMTKEALEKMPTSQAPMLSASEVWNLAEETIAKMAKDVFAQMPPAQPSQISDETLRAMVDEKVASMTKGVLENMPSAQPSALSPSDMWSVADEAVQKIAKEFFEKQPLTQTPQRSDETLRSTVEEVVAKTVQEALGGKAISEPLSIPKSELRTMAEETVSRMALEIFSDMTPPIPKISEDTVRKGIEDAVMKVAREVAREVIEKVAWETVPQLAEVMIKEEIERLKMMET